jgi:penicillin amidase
MIDRVQQERPGFRYVWYGGDETVLRLLEERPAHLLNPEYADWDELLARVFVGMVRDLGPGGGGGIETQWGELNRAAISHPAAMVAPGGASEALRAPRTPMSGDAWAVRVARPGFGASERFAISPGREESGLLHMPGGQSGHPLSPHFQDQHRAWLSGQPLPLLTGEAVGTVRLVPPPNGEE